MTNIFEQFKTKYKGKTAILSCGQAGFIIKNKKDKFLGIDLYLSDCVEKDEGHVGFKRLLPKIFSPEELELNVIIATHEHKDHFDIDSMEMLMSNVGTHLYTSQMCRELCEELGIDEKIVTYVNPGDAYDDSGFKMEFVNCDHGQLAPDAVGVIIEVDGRSIYFTGDTCLRMDYAEKIIEKRKIDILIAPINGAYGNLDDEDCVKLAQVIKPELTIPCHYWMFAAHGGDPWRFINLMNDSGMKYKIFPQGDMCEV